MNFPVTWRKWIKACLSLAGTSVLVNGLPTKEFKVTCGLREGDPLSPFLHLLVMEALSIVMDTAKDQNLFLGVQLPNNGPNISQFILCR